MKITVLTENTSLDSNIGAEHGLSLYIETKKHRILFDMGQTDLFAINAEKLGIDLSRVDIAVLSHGHYDHGGGLNKFLELNNNAPIYVSKFAFEPHYNGKDKYIGLDTALKNCNRLIFTDDYIEIDNTLSLYAKNSSTMKFHLGSFGLNTLENGVFKPDDFRHEQYMMIKENDMNVLISGCSHKGILNIVDWFDADIIIGGFHFSKLPLNDKLKSYAQYLNNRNTIYYTCHCTGIEQFEFMRNYMNNLHYISAGNTITL